MNEYELKYQALIQYRLENTLDKKPFETSLHHIKPRSLYPELANNKQNLIVLTIKEHILAHKYLMLWYKDLYGENSKEYLAMFNAYRFFIIGKNGKLISEQEATELAIEARKVISIQTKERWKDPNYKLRLSKAHSKPLSTQHCIAIGLGLKGRIPWNKGKHFNKKNSQYNKIRGRIRVNNGIIERCVSPTNIPDGFVKGRLHK